jgi:hemerythrin-like domain-containing protein
MADFKALHKEWKKAKDSAKLVYDGWAKANTDLSNAHVEVKFDLPSFPKFKLDLGPSLDDIEKERNVEKNKTKAEKAISQYEKDIKSLLRGVDKVLPGDDKKKVTLQKGLIKYVNDLSEVLDKIEKALKTLDK